MKKKILFSILVLIFALGTVMAGCSTSEDLGSTEQSQNGEVAQQSQGYQDIGPEDLKQMMSSDKNLIIVDVREKEEFAEGHITGAQLVPLSEFQSRVNELPKDKKIVLVCLSGSRSSQAAAYMAQLGYQHVYNLTGGLSAWPYEVVK